jgi:hypothetical protein
VGIVKQDGVITISNIDGMLSDWGDVVKSWGDSETSDEITKSEEERRRG